jgi:hypothetical protein
MEKTIEKLLFASRWILAPVYLGLSLALVALGIKFFMELFHLLTEVFTMEEANLVLILLGLVDMVLVGSLIVMVMFSGYENFVSALDVDRRDFLDSPVAAFHGSGRLHPRRQQRGAHVVRDHPPHLRGLGRDDGRARSHHLIPAPRPQRRSLTAVLSIVL